MEVKKVERTIKARLVTRRTNEILNAVKTECSSEEIEEKIARLKASMDELGSSQDSYMVYCDEESNCYEIEEEWYYNYDVKVNIAIREAKEYIQRKNPPIQMAHNQEIDISALKLNKLEIPTFRSDHKEYFAWKDMFERCIIHLDVVSKFDYLYSHTKGDANIMIKEEHNYHDAIKILDKEYGNKNYILKLLLDDIRKLDIVKKGDHKSFQNLSREINSFRSRFRIMGMENELENAFVLQELECKLNYDDRQKWFESLNESIEDRKVEDFCNWMNSQAHLRKLLVGASTKKVDHVEKNATIYFLVFLVASCYLINNISDQSTGTQLLNYLYDCLSNVSAGKAVDTIHLDIKKDFERLPHRRYLMTFEIHRKKSKET